MCMANVSNLMNKTLSARLRETISVNDPLSRKLGYAGLADPIGDFQHRQAGTKSKTMLRAERMGERQATAERNAAYKTKVYETPSAHVKNISSRQG